MQVVERLVGNDARRHVHDVALGDGFGFGVGVERLAEQRDRGRRRRGGERDEQLVAVVLADDLGDLLFRVLLRRVSASGSSDLRNGRRMAAPIWPSCERWASSIRNATRSFFNSGFFSISSSTQANFCCVVTMIGLRSLRKRGRSSAFLRHAHHVLQVGEILDVLPDVRVERFAVGEDEHDVHQLLARAGLEEAVQPVGQPADRERLAAAGGMVDEILAADVAGRGEMRRDVVRHFPHHAALVVARETA